MKTFLLAYFVMYTIILYHAIFIVYFYCSLINMANREISVNDTSYKYI